jgi:hypothetical protein
MHPPHPPAKQRPPAYTQVCASRRASLQLICSAGSASALTSPLQAWAAIGGGAGASVATRGQQPFAPRISEGSRMAWDGQRALLARGAMGSASRAVRWTGEFLADRPPSTDPSASPAASLWLAGRAGRASTARAAVSERVQHAARRRSTASDLRSLYTKAMSEKFSGMDAGGNFG